MLRASPVTLTLHTTTGVVQLLAEPGRSLREVLEPTAWRVRSACGGVGACGGCAVQWLAGEVAAPSAAECRKLTPQQRNLGLRLACQLSVLGDCEFVVQHTMLLWKEMLDYGLPPSPHKLDVSYRYAVALDVGTTHMRLALWDCQTGERQAAYCGANPQQGYGADVLNRLMQREVLLGELVRVSVVQLLRNLTQNALAQIGKMLVVGNTAMLALLSDRGGQALLAPENWQRAIDCTPPDPVAWRAAWYMPQAQIELLPPLAGFVGSDLLADVLATNLLQSPPGAMLLDVGTNTEIALWDGQVLHVTSVPGGPAFESDGMRNGLNAEAGAICRVDAQLQYQTIDQQPARGFCGSGLVDVIAVLLQRGQLKPSGRFAVLPGEAGFRLDADNPCTAIFSSDIDTFQRAKAATSAAMAELLAQAGMNWSQLTRLCLCGAFGHTLNIQHAQQVGLLPDMNADCVEFYADAALAGCEQILLGDDAAIATIRACARVVNLSLAPGYDERYINHLRLEPVPVVGI